MALSADFAHNQAERWPCAATQGALVHLDDESAFKESLAPRDEYFINCEDASAVGSRETAFRCCSPLLGGTAAITRGSSSAVP